MSAKFGGVRRQSVPSESFVCVWTDRAQVLNGYMWADRCRYCTGSRHLSLSLTHTHTHSLSLSLTHTHSLSLSLSLAWAARGRRGQGPHTRETTDTLISRLPRLVTCPPHRFDYRGSSPVRLTGLKCADRAGSMHLPEYPSRSLSFYLCSGCESLE